MNKKGCITIGMLMITLLTSPFLAIGAVRLFFQDDVYIQIEDISAGDTALVLGAAAYPSRLSDMLEDRVDTAIELYENDKVKKLIMTGGPDEAPAMRAYAVEKGIPEKNIEEDPNGFNTLASVKNLEGKENSIIIVSQNYHLPRALFIAWAMDIDAVGMGADKQLYIGMDDYEKREFWATGKAILDVLFKD